MQDYSKDGLIRIAFSTLEDVLNTAQENSLKIEDYHVNDITSLLSQWKKYESKIILEKI